MLASSEHGKLILKFVRSELTVLDSSEHGKLILKSRSQTKEKCVSLVLNTSELVLNTFEWYEDAMAFCVFIAIIFV